jgi:hypothetical protein
MGGVTLYCAHENPGFTEFLYRISAVIVGWLMRDMLSDLSPLLRSAWAGVLIPGVALLVLAAIRRCFDMGTRLGLYICASWGEKLVLYGNSPVPCAGIHIRFGPNNTNDRR